MGIKRVPQGPGGEGRQECVLDWGKLVLRIEKKQRRRFLSAKRTGGQGGALPVPHIPRDRG